jgi:hypothetical protein
MIVGQVKRVLETLDPTEEVRVEIDGQSYGVAGWAIRNGQPTLIWMTGPGLNAGQICHSLKMFPETDPIYDKQGDSATLTEAPLTSQLLALPSPAGAVDRARGRPAGPDPEPIPPGWVHIAPGSAVGHFWSSGITFGTSVRPSIWCRFWSRVLLGWRWSKGENVDQRPHRIRLYLLRLWARYCGLALHQFVDRCDKEAWWGWVSRDGQLAYYIDSYGRLVPRKDGHV